MVKVYEDGFLGKMGVKLTRAWLMDLSCIAHDATSSLWGNDRFVARCVLAATLFNTW